MGQFTMGSAAWRDALLPASFRGVTFHIESDSQSGGRRVALHEFPCRNTPFAEDMGRRAHHWSMTAFVIGTDYTLQRDKLINALDQDGAGSLQHPTLGTVQAICEQYESREMREKGGIATFQLGFVEAGSVGPAGTILTSIVQNTASQALNSASNLLSGITSSITSAIGGLF